MKRDTITNLREWLSEEWEQSESKTYFRNHHLEAIKVTDTTLIYCEDIRASQIIKKLELPVSKREIFKLVGVK